MSAATMLKLANRRDLDLLDPHPEDYAGFVWCAEHLAKEARYNGATPGRTYTVAHHLLFGARAILAETGDRLLAAYYSLHDVHEAVLKDDTTPKKRAIAQLAQSHFGVLAVYILDAFAALTDRHDAAIHAAAGLAWPPPEHLAAQVKLWDVRMFVTEWRDLMDNAPHPAWTDYADVPPLDLDLAAALTRTLQVKWDLVELWVDLLPALAAPASSPPAGGRHPVET